MLLRIRMCKAITIQRSILYRRISKTLFQIMNSSTKKNNQIVANISQKMLKMIHELLAATREVDFPPSGEQDLSHHFESVIDALREGPLATDRDDVEANELIELLESKTSHLTKLAEAYTEIASERFGVDELPSDAYEYRPGGALSSNTLYGTTATIASAYHTRGSLDRTPKDPSSVYNTNDGPSRSKLNLRTKSMGSTNGYALASDRKPVPRRAAATLTGGGDGPALPPVEGIKRLITFDKKQGEDLGVTVVQQSYVSPTFGLVKELIVKRIMKGSVIDKHGLLHEGDVVREANGVFVDNPEALQKILRNSSGKVTFKIIPGNQTTSSGSRHFLRAHFSYNPKFDNLIPSKEAGLVFAIGDILQILNQNDPHWWQARHFNHQQRAGLIPSVVLQERRKAFTQSAPNPEDVAYKLVACGLARRRRKNVVVPFRARDAVDYESSNISLYEEVALISSFQRPVICLLGASGVGRRTLRDSILRQHPDLYGTVVLYTSKQPDPDFQEKDEFIVEKSEKMELDKIQNKFLEFGETDGDYYGLKFDSIRDVIQTGRTCLLNCSPQSVAKIRNAEFMPFVILLAAPSVSCMKAMYEYGMSMGFTNEWKRDEDFRQTLEESRDIELNYRHLIDCVMLCDNIEASCDRLTRTLEQLLTMPQWVPAKWLY